MSIGSITVDLGSGPLFLDNLKPTSIYCCHCHSSVEVFFPIPEDILPPRVVSLLRSEAYKAKILKFWLAKFDRSHRPYEQFDILPEESIQILIALGVVSQAELDSYLQLIKVDHKPKRGRKPKVRN